MKHSSNCASEKGCDWKEHPQPCDYCHPCNCQLQKEQEKCDCKEMSCKKDCKQKHTHKGFFCNICEPVASSKMLEPSQPKEDWIERVQKFWEKHHYLKSLDKVGYVSLFNDFEELLTEQKAEMELDFKKTLNSGKRMYEIGRQSVIKEIERKIDDLPVSYRDDEEEFRKIIKNIKL